MCLCLQATFVMLKELETKPNKRYKTKSSLRNPNNLLLEYRILQALTYNVNQIFGLTALPFNGLVGQFVIFSLVTLIRDWADLDLYSIYVLAAASFMSIVFWSFLLELGGQNDDLCKQVLKSWKNVQFQDSFQAKYFFKMRKACPRIQIGVPGTFTIKRKTVLNFIKGISRGTFRALVALKSA
jgi:hypothetical protein